MLGSILLSTSGNSNSLIDQNSKAQAVTIVGKNCYFITNRTQINSRVSHTSFNSLNKKANTATQSNNLDTSRDVILTFDGLNRWKFYLLKKSSSGTDHLFLPKSPQCINDTIYSAISIICTYIYKYLYYQIMKRSEKGWIGKLHAWRTTWYHRHNVIALLSQKSDNFLFVPGWRHKYGDECEDFV